MEKSVTTSVPLQWCPCCFHKFECASNFTDYTKPQPGDFCVCIECASVLRFGDDMMLVLSSLEAITDAPSRYDFAKAVAAIKTLGAFKGKYPRVM